MRGGGRQPRPHPGRPDRVRRCSGGARASEEGGRINTDFIDNSAGVDTSDHEVNIKILLDRVVKDGDLTGKQRNSLLAEMTDEVAALVLRDNYEQNLALANAVAHAPSLLHVHEDFMRRLETGRHPRPRDRGAAVAAGGTPPARPRPRAHPARARGADGVDQDRAGRRAAGRRPARRPLPRPGPQGVLPDADARVVHGADRGAPAAPGDHRDPGGQRPGQRRRHDLLAAAGRRDRRHAAPT